MALFVYLHYGYLIGTYTVIKAKDQKESLQRLKEQLSHPQYQKQEVEGLFGYKLSNCDEYEDLYQKLFHKINLEELLRFLEQKKDNYPLWANDPQAYTLFKDYLINSAGDFNRFFDIDSSRRTFLAMVSVMKRVEDFSIKKAISPELLKAIKAQFRTGTPDDDTQELPAASYCSFNNGHSGAALRNFRWISGDQ